MPQKPIDFEPEAQKIDFEPINFEPVEGPTIERALHENKDPNAGGQWVKRGLTTQWIPTTPIDMERRPDTQLFGGYEGLVEQGRRNLEENLRQYLPQEYADPYARLVAGTTNFGLGALGAPENVAGGAGIYLGRKSLPWLERIAAEDIPGPVITPEPIQPSIRGLLPEQSSLSPDAFVLGPDIPKTTPPLPNFIAGPTGKVSPTPEDPYSPLWNQTASKVTRGPRGRMLPEHPIYNQQGQALPGQENLPSAPPKPIHNLASIYEANNIAQTEKMATGVTTIPEPPKIDDNIVNNLLSELKPRMDLTQAEKDVAARALGQILTGKKPGINESNLLGHIYGRDEMIRVYQNLPGGESKINYWADRLNLPRALQASFDLSAPFRQGVGLIHKGAWWRSWDDMVKSFGSEKTYKDIMDSITSDELFKPRAYFKEVPVKGGVKKVAMVDPSYADEAGLALTDLAHINSREEALASNLAEKIPGIGKGVRASNRAYTAFLNKLRADTFKSMIKDSKLAYETSKNLAKTPEEIAQVELMNPDTNLVLRKAIAGYINNASGRGSLGALEKYATPLNTFLYSPRLIASRVNMVKNLAFAPKAVRMEYWKSMGALAGVWATTASLAHLAGAEVSFDPTNADFMKPKFGNTRLDPGAGFLQYMVYLSRMGLQRTTSSTTIDPNTGEPQTYQLNSKFGGDTVGDVTRRFVANKMNPIGKEIHDIMWERKDYQPYNYADRAAKLVTPFIIQDLTELINNDVGFFPLIVGGSLAGTGMGLSTYERGGEPTFFGEGGAVNNLLGR